MRCSSFGVKRQPQGKMGFGMSDIEHTLFLPRQPRALVYPPLGRGERRANAFGVHAVNRANRNHLLFALLQQLVFKSERCVLAKRKPEKRPRQRWRNSRRRNWGRRKR